MEELGTPIEALHETTPAFETPKDTYGGISILRENTGAKMAWSSDYSELKVNTTLFPDTDQANVATIRQVGRHLGITQALRDDPTLLLELTKTHPEASESVLQWQGLARLKETNPTLLREQPIAGQKNTFTHEFRWAIDSYILTGKYPDELSAPVQQALERIPQPNGQNLIDYIASGRYLKFDGENFATHIQPLIDELSQADQQSGKSQKFEYRPAQTQDTSGSKEALEESDITVRVDPFYGGYYRERVCHYDPNSRQIVTEAGDKQTWTVDDSPDDEKTWGTRRNYEGLVQSGKETIIKLPYRALPLLTTLDPAFQLMRDELGTISLEPRTHDQAAATTFSFDFVLADTPSNQFDTPPTDRDRTPAGGLLDEETQTFLDDLSGKNWISDVQKEQEITRYVRKKFKYPEDETEVTHIDNLYHSVSSQDLWTKIAEVGIAHCYWANIFRDELCKRLGLASRIVIGKYVESDPRFTFAVVEAPGLAGHAWSEGWDADKEVWTHYGMDATPSKTQEEREKQDEEAPLDGDFGESMTEEEQQPLTEEEIQELYNKLYEEGSNATSKESLTPKDRAALEFKKETGVSWDKWKNLESWINDINKTPVPAQSSITKSPSNLYNEYRTLFDLFLERRQIPRQAYKGPVRQSEGDVLTDPVTAYIDIASGDNDPLGYAIETKKPEEHNEVSAFDDDWIADLSGSMYGAPAGELQKMILSSAYNIMQLDRRLQHSNNSSQMRTPLHIRSTQIAFGTEAKTIFKQAVMDEKALIKLNKALQEELGTSEGLEAALEAYRDSLDPKTLQEIREGKRKKVLTIVSDGDVENSAACVVLIKELRNKGIPVQGLGFGSEAEDIRVICHDPTDPNAAVVLNDVRQATVARHQMLIKHLAKI